MSKLKIAGTINDSIVDGEGLRFTIFTQGCPHHCIGCHNPKTHDFNDGYFVDTNTLFNQIADNILLSGVTFSGGEPFCQAEALYDLATRIKNETSLNIIVYSGYTYAELKELKDPFVNKLLNLTYQLIDGKFVEELKDLELEFRGSSNQNIINLNNK